MYRRLGWQGELRSDGDSGGGGGVTSDGGGGGGAPGAARPRGPQVHLGHRADRAPPEQALRVGLEGGLDQEQLQQGPQGQGPAGEVPTPVLK